MPDRNEPTPLEVAKRQVGFLITIGHPWQERAVEATALLLMKWCESEEQAQALVEKAAETWNEGWPEKGGAVQLLALYRQMFPQLKPKEKDVSAEERVAQLLAEGRLAPRCELCPADEPYCRYGGKVAHAWYEDYWTRPEMGPPEPPPRKLAEPKPFIPITEATVEQLLERGKANYTDEQSRKREQLERDGFL